jgi:hypothetical protein
MAYGDSGFIIWKELPVVGSLMMHLAFGLLLAWDMDEDSYSASHLCVLSERENSTWRATIVTETLRRR